MRGRKPGTTDVISEALAAAGVAFRAQEVSDRFMGSLIWNRRSGDGWTGGTRTKDTRTSYIGPSDVGNMV